MVPWTRGPVDPWIRGPVDPWTRGLEALGPGASYRLKNFFALLCVTVLFYAVSSDSFTINEILIETIYYILYINLYTAINDQDA